MPALTSRLRRPARAAVRALPALLFALALLVAGLLWGVSAERYEIFPYAFLRDGYRSWGAALGLHAADDDIAGYVARRADYASGRIARPDAMTEGVFWYGGREQFRDRCPEHGCLAVRYDAAGQIVQSWPWRPRAVGQAAAAAAAADPDAIAGRELALGYSYEKDLVPRGLARYPNGDLLAAFRHRVGKGFPFPAGLARLDADGYPVWFRAGFSHHWPLLEADGTALVPGARIEPGRPTYVSAGVELPLDCPAGETYRDAVDFIAPDGRLLRSLDVYGAMASSPWAPLLDLSDHPCDPLHLNFVSRIAAGPAAGDLPPGVSPGDLVVSFRDVDAFAILDPADGSARRVARGSWDGQHAVQHWRGAEFLLLDNRRRMVPGQASRLLAVNLVTGAERTVFPTVSTAPEHRLHTELMGRVSLSPDRRRALVSFTEAGRALEIRLADGAVLNEFRSWHDVSGTAVGGGAGSDSLAVMHIYGMDYAP